MTDTTDKLSLQKLKDVRELCLPRTAWRSIIDELISARDQLEAERQRADKSDAMLSECLESLKAAEKELGIRSHQLVKADASVADLEKRLRCTEEAMIAATDLHGEDLKGEQVPVAEIKFHPSTDKHPCMYWFGKQDRDFPVGTQFFTAPQKPVVLLPKFTDRHTCMNAGCDAAAAYKEDVITINKAAGGIVKDGE